MRGTYYFRHVCPLLRGHDTLEHVIKFGTLYLSLLSPRRRPFWKSNPGRPVYTHSLY